MVIWPGSTYGTPGIYSACDAVVMLATFCGLGKIQTEKIWCVTNETVIYIIYLSAFMTS